VILAPSPVFQKGKDEEAWLIIVGEGPATLTRVEEAK